MPAAVKLRTDYSVDELRRLAKGSKDANQTCRLLSLAGVLDGMKRADAARIGGMDRQTLRDWVHRFNKAGPNLRDVWASGPAPRLSAAQKAQFAGIVEAGSDREIDGVVRWRRIDLKRVIAAPFGARTQPGREHLAISAQQLAFQRVFDTYDAISDAACEAGRKLIAEPQTITSIGMRDWAHVGRS